MNFAVSAPSEISISLAIPNMNDKMASGFVQKLTENKISLIALTIIGPFEANKDGLEELGGKAVLKFASESTSLQNLDLAGNNQMGDKVANAVCEMLKNNKSLRSLNLQDCGLTDESASFIAEGLKHNNTLKELKITSNSFNEVGLDTIRRAAEGRVSLDIS